MSQILRFLLSLSLLSVPNFAVAGELEWEFLGASGFGNGLGCTKDDVTVAAAGNDLSIIYSKMNVTLPAGGPSTAKTQSGQCLVFLKVTVPTGETITQTQASVIGGIEKDQGVYAYITAISYLTKKVARLIHPHLPGVPFGPVLYLNRVMLPRDAINEPLFQMDQAKDLNKVHKKSICKMTATKPAEFGMTIRLAVAAVRPKTDKTAIINVDTVDGHLDLAMNTEACR